MILCVRSMKRVGIVTLNFPARIPAGLLLTLGPEDGIT